MSVRVIAFRPRPRRRALTDRQIEAIRLLLTGRVPSEAALELGISRNQYSRLLRDARRALGHRTTYQMMYALGEQAARMSER